MFKEVDAGGRLPTLGEEQGVLSGSTARVEQRAGDPTGRIDKDLLRFADLPRRLALVGLLKVLFPGNVLRHQGAP